MGRFSETQCIKYFLALLTDAGRVCL